MEEEDFQMKFKQPMTLSTASIQLKKEMYTQIKNDSNNIYKKKNQCCVNWLGYGTLFRPL